MATIPALSAATLGFLLAAGSAAAATKFVAPKPKAPATFASVHTATFVFTKLVKSGRSVWRSDPTGPIRQIAAFSGTANVTLERTGKAAESLDGVDLEIFATAPLTDTARAETLSACMGVAVTALATNTTAAFAVRFQDGKFTPAQQPGTLRLEVQFAGLGCGLTRK